MWRPIKVTAHLSLLLLLVSCYTPVAQLMSMKQDVVLQIVIPHQTSAVNKYENAHANAKQTIKHGRESDYNNLRKRFSINTWLNFTDSNSPKEILNLYCKEIFAKHVNAILSLNYGTDTASSNNYIMKLAENLGYPVISWDPNYPGALEVKYIF
ncbi:hypothetical protein DPMN_032608 [Dreissena polymorpha]|uniref:Uncharacterized protein n=1 Tax=Dreissena polymorpha TaxID=45954 RepID=A0A9D4M6X8_DREPO|nr:hypothetical protein DPMN_032608 [Dreissena polymorpha]